MPQKRILSINRAPVLTLWAVVVARRLGFRKAEALTLGKAVAGLNAQSKGRRLGIYSPKDHKPKEAREKKFGEELDRVEATMQKLAMAYKPNELADEADSLYERFRPDIPGGKKGWGTEGDLDLA